MKGQIRAFNAYGSKRYNTENLAIVLKATEETVTYTFIGSSFTKRTVTRKSFEESTEFYF